MHLADGILSSVSVTAGLNLFGACGVALAVKRSLGQLRTVAWTGTLAAFVLVAQALNLPLLPGASAHAIGAGLLTLVVGPAHAVVALFAVLVVQALLLADGGITVLGINALNIAVLPVLAITACRRAFGESRRGLMMTAVVGTLLGSALGAASLTLALVYGASAPAPLTFAWLLGVQSLAGLIEGALTALAVRQLYGRAPGLLAEHTAVAARTSLDEPPPAPLGKERLALKVAACAILVLLLLLPFASSSPDALEFVLERLQAER
jgi:cobalt/nickel transport system permease protein